MRAFAKIPDNHIAAKNADGEFLMVDCGNCAPQRGLVFAKAFGVHPLIVTAGHARRRGMKILGAVVGTFPAGRLLGRG